jgi:spermidine/putrescine transport system permease protein
VSAAGHISSLGPAEAQLDGPPDPEGQKRGWAGYFLLLPGGLWLLLFFVVPTVTLVATSLYDPAGSLQLGYQMTWHWQNYVDALQDYGPQFVRSLIYASIATIACILLGFPLAYAIAFKAGRYKNLMLVAVIAPFFTSFLIRTLSWQYILGDNEPLVSLLRTLHILGPDGYLLATPFAVVTGLTYNFLPFMVLPLYASLEKIDPRLIEAGADLYASPITTFRTVTLRLAMPGLVAGTLLTFIPAAGDYINSELLGNPQTRMVGNEIQDLFGAGDYPTAAALSVTLMSAIVLLVFLYVRRAGTEELV